MSVLARLHAAMNRSLRAKDRYLTEIKLSPVEVAELRADSAAAQYLQVMEDGRLLFMCANIVEAEKVKRIAKPSIKWTADKLADVKLRGDSGDSLAVIGSHYGLTAERIRQVLAKIRRMERKPVHPL